MVLAVACLLAGCGQAVAPSATPGRAPLVAVQASVTRSPSPTPSPSMSPSATPAPSATPSRTPAPSPTPQPTATAVPTAAPAVAGEPLPMSLGWRFDANAHLSAGIAGGSAGQGTAPILLATLGRAVYALDTAGRLLWQARAPGPVYALAALDGGRVAVAGDEGLTLLGAGGERLWQVDLGSRVTGLAPDGAGGLLAGGWDEQLSSLDAGGAIRWQASLGAPVDALAYLPGADLAVVATADGRVWAFDQTGAERWQVVAPGPIVGLGLLPLAADAAADLVLSLRDGRLLRLDATGRMAPLFTPQVPGEGGPTWQVADLAGESRPEIVVGTAGDAPQLALLSTDGQVLWRVALPAAANALAVVEWEGRQAILAGLASGQVQAYDAQGRLLSEVQAGLPVWRLVSAGQGVLALADVAAWQILPRPGPVGAAWLRVPALAPLGAAAELPGQAQPPDPGQGATLVFLGDVVPGRSMEAQLARLGPEYPWQGLQPLLGDADLAVANLESVLSVRGRPMDKRYLIRAHPRWGQALAAGGVDLVTLANNHVLDYGQAGLDETLQVLDELGIARVGAGRSAAEASQPWLVTLNGVRVAVLGYAGAYWNGSVDMPATANVAWSEPPQVQAEVRAVRNDADVVVVILHAGTEYAATPSDIQVAVAHAAVDAGADLVVGHHPHVTQTVERYGRGLIVYSLGNALFDIPRQAAMRGDLLRVHVTRDGLQQAELWPFWIEAAIRPRLLAAKGGGVAWKVVYPAP